MVSIKPKGPSYPSPQKNEMAQKTNTEKSIVVLFIAVFFSHAESTIPLTSGSPFSLSISTMEGKGPRCSLLMEHTTKIVLAFHPERKF